MSARQRKKRLLIRTCISARLLVPHGHFQRHADRGSRALADDRLEFELSAQAIQSLANIQQAEAA